jgi:hypothetical protein
MPERRVKWPPGGEERLCYLPLCSLLEEIRLVVEPARGIETDFRFVVSDLEMRDHLGGVKALKPDLLGLYGRLKDKEYALWSRPIIAIEVKRDEKPMLEQGGDVCSSHAPRPTQSTRCMVNSIQS